MDTCARLTSLPTLRRRDHVPRHRHLRPRTLIAQRQNAAPTDTSAPRAVGAMPTLGRTTMSFGAVKKTIAPAATAARPAPRETSPATAQVRAESTCAVG